MALIEFKDYPDTTTPANAQNLNSNFNELKKLQNEITVGLSSNVTHSSGGSFKIPINTILNQIGDKITFLSNENAILIGSGINYVEVSGQVMQLSSHSNLCGLYIAKNGSALANAVAVGFNYINVVNVNIITAMSPTIVSVNEGDKIYLYGYSDQANKTVTYSSYSGKSNYITVKAIS